jgi:hypothetical protein
MFNGNMFFLCQNRVVDCIGYWAGWGVVVYAGSIFKDGYNRFTHLIKYFHFEVVYCVSVRGFSMFL